MTAIFVESNSGHKMWYCGSPYPMTHYDVGWTNDIARAIVMDELAWLRCTRRLRKLGYSPCPVDDHLVPPDDSRSYPT